MTDFSVFAAQAHVEKIEHALAEVLLEDEELHEFFDGRIVVTPEPFTFPDLPVPFLTISSIQEGDVQRLNSEREITLPVALGGFYDELREIIEDTSERTVKSLIQRLKVVILANPRLSQTSISQNALVDRVLEFQAFPFPPIAEGEANAIFNFQLVATFQYGVDVATGVP